MRDREKERESDENGDTDNVTEKGQERETKKGEGKV